VIALRLGALVLVWLAVLATADPLDVLLGAVASAVVLAVPAPGAPLDGGDVPLARRLAASPRFALAVLADVVRGTWDVALRVLHLRELEHPGFVEVPIGDRTELGLAVSALATTLSPGAVLVDVDEERGVMLLHVIDASDPAAVVAAHERFYERAQRGVLP
jgi:multicomponent Na+:H+ antiporter subunit E